jgi:hypothetical protein
MTSSSRTSPIDCARLRLAARFACGLSAALADAEPAALIAILAPVFDQLAKPESGLAPAK